MGVVKIIIVVIALAMGLWTFVNVAADPSLAERSTWWELHRNAVIAGFAIGIFVWLMGTVVSMTGHWLWRLYGPTGNE
jgi:hypothetical protein